MTERELVLLPTLSRRTVGFDPRPRMQALGQNGERRIEQRRIELDGIAIPD